MVLIQNHLMERLIALYVFTPGDTQLAVFVGVCFWALRFVCNSATSTSDKVAIL